MTTSLDPSGDLAEVRQLVERYAAAVDRRDPAAAAELFTESGEFELWLEPAGAAPTVSRHGRAEIAAALSGLDRYRATHHEIANIDIDVSGDTASGWTQCTAHHLEPVADRLVDRVLYLSYAERLARVDGRWRFARRVLRVKWVSVLPVESG